MSGHSPLRNTDHIYRSNQKSAISRPTSESKKKRKGNTTPKIVRPGSSSSQGVAQSADVYYRNYNEQAAGARPQAEPAEEVATTPRAQSVVTLRVTQYAELNWRVDRAIAVATQTDSLVRLLLQDKDWVRTARMRIELATARNEITESQARNIIFGVIDPTEVVSSPVKKDEATQAINTEPVTLNYFEEETDKTPVEEAAAEEEVAAKREDQDLDDDSDQETGEQDDDSDDDTVI